MGEPPYHLRKTCKCASTWISTMKTHSCLPWNSRFWWTKPETFQPFGLEKEKENERWICVLSVKWNAFSISYILSMKFQWISFSFTFNLQSKSQKGKHYAHQLFTCHFMSSVMSFNQSITHINQSKVTSLKVTFDLTLDVTIDLTLDVTCVAALEFEIRMRSQSHSGSGSLILN